MDSISNLVEYLKNEQYNMSQDKIGIIINMLNDISTRSSDRWEVSQKIMNQFQFHFKAEYRDVLISFYVCNRDNNKVYLNIITNKFIISFSYSEPNQKDVYGRPFTAALCYSVSESCAESAKKNYKINCCINEYMLTDGIYSPKNIVDINI